MEEKNNVGKMPRASLHTTCRGEGAPLLMIHGIISDSTFFEESASILAHFYRVITYDRRGYGLSNQEQYEDYTVSAQAEDAANVLREYCREPAWILGNSAGGVIALELALTHQELVRGLVLLEPSLGYVEEEREKLLAWNRELNGYVAEGKGKKALPAFSRVTGTMQKRESFSLQELRRTYQNLSVFLEGELNEVQHYLPPIERLQAIAVPVVVAVTERGRKSVFATSSQTGAQKIGWQVVHFPGYHNVAQEMPLDFALMLNGVIAGMEYINENSREKK